jgi:ribosomal protein S18 acetylase RimI-like enzyme
MSVTLRPPLPTDYDVIASWVSDAEACRRWGGPKVPFPFVANELAQLLAVPGGGSYCLAGEGAAPLGFGQYWPRPGETIHLLRIIVSPTSRGKGLGRELCGQLIAHALAAAPARSVTLNVYRDNEAAVALYKWLGFEVVPDKSKGDSLFMAKPVTAQRIASG